MGAVQTSANMPLAQVGEGNNHRKYFDKEKLDELAASVKTFGVLQPILVRPRAKPAGKVTHLVVAGERRLRAARLAGLKTIPVIIIELTDKEALEVGLIENLRRADVLPMEEAEGYRELHEVHGESVEQIAERVGKSKELVYGRMKLTELKSPAMRKALEDGRASPSLALLVARIAGVELQERAAKKILEGGPYGDNYKPTPMSHRRALEVVQDEYMLQLSKAPFSVKDAKLVPEAGACGPCPKRTGNCKALYPDVKSEQVCTDPDCFGKKKTAAFKLEQQAAKENGQRLLKDSKALWHYGTDELSHGAKERYVALTDKCPGDKKGRTFKELLGDKAEVVLARAPSGKLRHLLEKEGLAEALSAAGHTFKLKEKSEARSSGPRDYEKERKVNEFRERVVERLLSKTADAICAQRATPGPVLRVLASLSFSEYDDRVVPSWAKRLGLATGKQLLEEIGKLDAHATLAFVFDCVAGDELFNTWNGYRKEMPAICALAGVSIEDVEEEQRKADAASAPTAGAEQAPADGEDLASEEEP